MNTLYELEALVPLSPGPVRVYSLCKDGRVVATSSSEETLRHPKVLEFLGVNEPLGEPKALEGEPVSLLNESSACLLVYGEFVAFEDTFGHLVGDQLTVSESWGLASDV